MFIYYFCNEYLNKSGTSAWVTRVLLLRKSIFSPRLSSITHSIYNSLTLDDLGSQALAVMFYNDLSTLMEQLVTYRCLVIICDDFIVHGRLSRHQRCLSQPTAAVVSLDFLELSVSHSVWSICQLRLFWAPIQDVLFSKYLHMLSIRVFFAMMCCTNRLLLNFLADITIFYYIWNSDVK